MRGRSITGTVATVTDSRSYYSTTSDFAATINWGDGHQTAGTVSGSYGSYTVTDAGNHIYTTPGNYTVSVTVSDDAPGTATNTNSTAITVAAASVTGIGTTVPANEAFTVGAVIPITLTFSAPVSVDTSGGTPVLYTNARVSPYAGRHIRVRERNQHPDVRLHRAGG